jgi:hypothetical protein
MAAPMFVPPNAVRPRAIFQWWSNRKGREALCASSHRFRVHVLWERKDALFTGKPRFVPPKTLAKGA